MRKEYFDNAKKAFAMTGTAVKYITTLKLTKKSKSELLYKVMMDVKGKLPKHDPFYTKLIKKEVKYEK